MSEGDQTEWIIDLYPGAERFGRITDDHGPGGFVTAVWCTGRTTRVRNPSVRQLANRRGGRRGYYRSTEAGRLAAVLSEVGRQDRADELLAESVDLTLGGLS